MKHNLMYLAIAASLMSPETGEGHANAGGPAAERQEEVKRLVDLPKDKIDSWLAEGKKMGLKASNLIGKGEAFARDVLIVYGQHLAGNEGAGDFLTGYASGWANPATGKVRKSEAKAVFDAFAMGEQDRELVQGTDETTKELVKETRTISEWLEGHEGVKGYEGYGGLIKMAKRLRGPASGQGAGGGRAPTVKFTDQQFEDVKSRIPAANANQAMTLAEMATKQLTKLPQFEMALFREISMIANQVKVKSNDVRFLDAANKMVDLVNDLIDLIAAKPGVGESAGKAPIVAPAPAAQAEHVEATQKTGTTG